MVKKVFKLLFFVLVYLLFSPYILANEDCSTGELQKLKAYANFVDIRYSYIKNYTPIGEELEYGAIMPNNRFEVTASNLQNNIVVLEDNGFNAFWYDSTRDNPNVMSLPLFIGGRQYVFNIHARTNTGCNYKLLKSIKINTPQFNPYSSEKECVGIEEHKYCDMWYSGPSFSKDEFLIAINTYREEKFKNNDLTAKNQWDVIIDYIVSNYIIIISLSGISLFVIYLLINYINKRRSIL